jgi:hypothetical protein
MSNNTGKHGICFIFCDYHQSSATVIYPQLHCVGWALPNTKQAFQDMVWHLL